MKLKNRIRRWHRHYKDGYVLFAGSVLAVASGTTAVAEGEIKMAFLWFLIVAYMILCGLLLCRQRVLERAGEVFERRAFGNGVRLALETCNKHLDRLQRINKILFKLLGADKQTMDDCSKTLDKILSNDGVILKGEYYKAVPDGEDFSCEQCDLRDECSGFNELALCDIFNFGDHFEKVERHNKEK